MEAIGRSIPEVEKLIGIWLPFVDAYSAGLWLFWITETEIIAVPRPSMLIENSRLHSAVGPAVTWPGGASYYFWRGTQVPAEWIEKRDTLSASIALTWKNIEQRRAAAEIIGWARVLEQLKPKTVDIHPNPFVGTLLRVDLPDAPGEQFLKVRCATRRDFVLCVSKTAKTALEAQTEMWTGLSQAEVLEALNEGRRA